MRNKDILHWILKDATKHQLYRACKSLWHANSKQYMISNKNKIAVGRRKYIAGQLGIYA